MLLSRNNLNMLGILVALSFSSTLFAHEREGHGGNSIRDEFHRISGEIVHYFSGETRDVIPEIDWNGFQENGVDHPVPVYSDSRTIRCNDAHNVLTEQDACTCPQETAAVNSRRNHQDSCSGTFHPGIGSVRIIVQGANWRQKSLLDKTIIVAHELLRSIGQSGLDENFEISDRIGALVRNTPDVVANAERLEEQAECISRYDGDYNADVRSALCFAPHPARSGACYTRLMANVESVAVRDTDAGPIPVRRWASSYYSTDPIASARICGTSNPERSLQCAMTHSLLMIQLVTLCGIPEEEFRRGLPRPEIAIEHPVSQVVTLSVLNGRCEESARLQFPQHTCSEYDGAGHCTEYRDNHNRQERDHAFNQCVARGIEAGQGI